MARNPSTSIVGELLVHILSNKLYLYIFENILSITTKTKKDMCLLFLANTCQSFVTIIVIKVFLTTET